MNKPNYTVLVDHYEQCFAEHGTTSKGVDWPNQTDLDKRYQVMLDLFSHEPIDKPLKILDLGCGFGGLVEYLNRSKSKHSIIYTGSDLSETMIKSARALYPNHQFITQDILKNPLKEKSYDYVLMNGVLTEKQTLSWDQMRTFACHIIQAAFKIAQKGVAFNVMNYHVDWCRPDLFYWSYENLADFLHENCSKHISFRSDYGLYEFTTYLYKEARI